jgi:hypothetical protein
LIQDLIRGDLRQAAEILRHVHIRGSNRQVFESRQAVDSVLRQLDDDGVGDAVLGVEPEVRVHLAAARKGDEQIVGRIALRQPDFIGERAVDVHIELRVVEDLLDARVRDAGKLADALQQIAPLIAFR